MRAPWPVLASLFFGLSLQAAKPSVLSNSPAPPEPPISTGEPSYFKTGILTLQDRIWAQTQIERVYYNHRIWPKENPGPKPPFETMVPAAVIEAKVTDSLKKSAALDQYWQHPVTGEMLQAELDRMAKQTRDPATLKELFEALHNDPRLIAETLAREALSDRLIRNWYAYDTRFHAEARAKAEALAARVSAAPGIDWKSLGGEYHHQRFILDDPRNHDESPAAAADERRVGSEEFTALKNKYLTTDNHPDPEETPDHFNLTHVMATTDARVETESVSIRKVSFQAWWGAMAPGFPAVASAVAAAAAHDRWHTPRIPAAAGCDSWGYAPGLQVPDGRAGHTAVWTGSEMIVWGGYGWDYLNDGGRYNPATDTWLPTSNGVNVPPSRNAHTAVWTGTVMIVWGGYSGSSNNSGGRYNPNTDAWQTVSIGANLPTPRYSHTAVWTGTEMIIWGGYDGTYADSGGRYDPSTDSWLATSTGSNVPAGRWIHSAVWTGSVMIVWGGSAFNFGTGIYEYYNTGGRYSPSTDSWQPTSTGLNVPAVRRSQTAIWTGTVMIVWGGDTGGTYMNTGGRYNPASDTWQATSVGANVPAVRTEHTGVWTGTVMIVWGGTNGSLYYNSGGRYNPATNSWLPTGTGANVPFARSNHSAIWTGTEMIVWGSYSGRTNTGGRYNLAGDSWLPTSTGAGVPSVRSAHSAVWTGAEMIVWGGGYNNTYLNTGGKYNPTTDAWAATVVSAGTPAGRSSHTAIWTGSRMVVWGGSSYTTQFNYFNSGGRYDPVGDAWQTTSTAAAAPVARERHSAVWTGSEMIAWGGFNNTNGTLNTGGRYNPSSDSWIPTATAGNTPSPRLSHTGIWTGSEMIIWGGGTGSGFLNSGGRYNPAGDSWLALSSGVNTPAARDSHVAVWTGSEMIIWGGYSGGFSYHNTGGRYNPSSDAWAPTSTGSNLPTGRAYLSAVWTGLEMIPWGGFDGGTHYFNTGGRYSPSTDSWNFTSTGANVPAGREVHTAVWTGSEMLVWGGFGIVTYNSGGSYASGAIASPGNSLRGGRTASINMSWASITGANSYNVKRCNPTTTSCIPGAIISTPATNQYSEPDDGISHFYAVEAVNQCGATP